MQQKIILTGGPGSGKTTLINELKAQHFDCIDEVSREVTLEAQKNGIPHLFLSNPVLFSQELLQKRIQQFEDASKRNQKTIFFDRGIPDIQAYLEFSKTKHTFDFSKINQEFRYQKVFITPPWEDIYTTDNERYESFEEAVQVYKQLLKTYTKLNYTPIEIPFGSIKQRTLFILEHL